MEASGGGNRSKSRTLLLLCEYRRIRAHGTILSELEIPKMSGTKAVVLKEEIGYRSARRRFGEGGRKLAGKGGD